jgi:hypothetical protein
MSGARIPVKVHRRVSLVLVEDTTLAEELLARKKLASDVAGRLTPTALLIRPGRVESVQEELARMGHTPKLVGVAEPETPAGKAKRNGNGGSAPA